MLRSNSQPNLKWSLAQTSARTILISALLLTSAVVLATPGVSRGAVIVSKDSVTLKWNPVGKSSKSNVVSFIRPAEERKTSPVVKILANHTSNHLNVPQGTPVNLSVTLDRIGDDYGSPDVWIVAETPLGLYSYHGYSGWVAGVYPFERSLSGTTVFELPTLYLSQGYYTFYLAVDDNADRIPDATWWDTVGVNVTGSNVW